MGVDAGFFNRKTKTYTWFDRYKNLMAHGYSDNISEDQYARQEDLLESLAISFSTAISDKKEAGLSNKLATEYIESNIKIAKQEADKDRSECFICWSNQVLRFINMEENKDGDFFIASDHSFAYDLIDDHNYIEIEESEIT